MRLPRDNKGRPHPAPITQPINCRLPILPIHPLQSRFLPATGTRPVFKNLCGVHSSTPFHTLCGTFSMLDILPPIASVQAFSYRELLRSGEDITQENNILPELILHYIL